MIVELLLNMAFGIAHGVLSLAPDISWSPDTSAFTYVHDILSVVCYLLPMGTVRTIVALLISLLMIRIFIAFIRFILQFIPFL